MMKEYIDAMLAQDQVALAECFVTEGRLSDYCPSNNDMQNFHICGKAAIEMFFLHKFFFHIITISDPVITSETTADYFVAYGTQYMHVQATIGSYDENGKIISLTVRPL